MRHARLCFIHPSISLLVTWPVAVAQAASPQCRAAGSYRPAATDAGPAADARKKLPGSTNLDAALRRLRNEQPAAVAAATLGLLQQELMAAADAKQGQQQPASTKSKVTVVQTRMCLFHVCIKRFQSLNISLLLARVGVYVNYLQKCALDPRKLS